MILMPMHYLVNRHVYDPHAQHLCCFVERCVCRHCTQDFGVLVPTLKMLFYFKCYCQARKESYLDAFLKF
jgi:hypothetical protein